MSEGHTEVVLALHWLLLITALWGVALASLAAWIWEDLGALLATGG